MCRDSRQQQILQYAVAAVLAAQGTCCVAAAGRGSLLSVVSAHNNKLQPSSSRQSEVSQRQQYMK